MTLGFSTRLVTTPNESLSFPPTLLQPTKNSPSPPFTFVGAAYLVLEYRQFSNGAVRLKNLPNIVFFPRLRDLTDEQFDEAALRRRIRGRHRVFVLFHGVWSVWLASCHQKKALLGFPRSYGGAELTWHIHTHVRTNTHEADFKISPACFVQLEQNRAKIHVHAVYHEIALFQQNDQYPFEIAKKTLFKSSIIINTYHTKHDQFSCQMTWSQHC